MTDDIDTTAARRVRRLSRTAARKSLESALTYLRKANWTVAAHNDYRTSHGIQTFWLWTHKATGRYIDGEGQTDLDALNKCFDHLDATWPE
jgi:hypothetical protein